VTDAADFIDAALQYEVSPYTYPSDDPGGLLRYGTSVGAVRGTIRDALKRYPSMSHDQVTGLSSELWGVPVFERRQAAIVLLQSQLEMLVANDLTRIEGFLRTAASASLVAQLQSDVLAPMLAAMDEGTLPRVRAVLRRWATDPSPAVASAARLGRST
jgi:hypothetical protein